jgi:hypothetical protein
MLTPEDRQAVARELPALGKKYPKLLINGGVAGAIVHPPSNPHECLFSKLSVNYSADLRSRVEPCVFGGSPDCTQCGCAASSALHWIRTIPLAGPVKVGHFVNGSIAVGRLMNGLRLKATQPSRWNSSAAERPRTDLVRIQSSCPEQ